MSVGSIPSVNLKPLTSDEQNRFQGLSYETKKKEVMQNLSTKSESNKEKPHVSHLCKIAGKQASLYGKDFDKNSSLAKHTRKMTELRWSDLEIGDLLGTGSFCHVYEVSLVQRREDSTKMAKGQSLETFNDSLDVWELLNQSGLATQEDTDETNQGKRSPTSVVKPSTFALKRLDPYYLEGQHDFTDCAIDLVMEARILSCLSHRHIIKLHAVTGGSVSRVFTKKGGYFLLLDRLYGSLQQRIHEWSDADISVSKHDRARRLEDRLKGVAVGVCRGMKYLHRNMVIYRDLKPANVGFTLDGEVKLFDFGLAREIVDEDRKMTGYTGSPRFMAPEVARHDYYGLSADVYSFGILLWELCSLKKAFAGLSKKEHLENVVGSKVRPPLNAFDGSSGLKKLIQSCWHDDPRNRPSFSEIRDQIFFELDMLVEAPGDSSKFNRFMRLRRQRRDSTANKKGSNLASLLLGSNSQSDKWGNKHSPNILPS